MPTLRFDSSVPSMNATVPSQGGSKNSAVIKKMVVADPELGLEIQLPSTEDYPCKLIVIEVEVFNIKFNFTLGGTSTNNIEIGANQSFIFATPFVHNEPFKTENITGSIHITYYDNPEGQKPPVGSIEEGNLQIPYRPNSGLKVQNSTGPISLYNSLGHIYYGNFSNFSAHEIRLNSTPPGYQLNAWPPSPYFPHESSTTHLACLPTINGQSFTANWQGDPVLQTDITIVLESLG